MQCESLFSLQIYIKPFCRLLTLLQVMFSRLFFPFVSVNTTDIFPKRYISATFQSVAVRIALSQRAFYINLQRAVIM